jgi:hypothetical protein
MMTTPAVEPLATPWRPRPISDLLRDVLPAGETHVGRPAILAVDGRQGSGKTTMANRFAALVEGAVVVHSDDVAWWEAFFAWDHLMAGGILEPLRRGEDVNHRPPAWEARERDGAIVVPATAPLVILEGVGVSRRSLAPSIDAAVWVQSDFDEARQRGIEREGGTQHAIDFWDEWDLEELPFLKDDRPWERANLVVCGTPDLAGVDFDPDWKALEGRLLRP